MHLYPATKVAWIKVLFEMETLGAQETLYKMGVPIPHGFDAAFAILL